MFQKALVCMLLMPSLAFAQIKIEGPKEGTVGYMVKIKVTELSGNDPKIKCFPDNPDWLATKDFDGTAYIIFVPGKKLLTKDDKYKLYTFVIAVNKDNKTYLETHEIKVLPDEDVPTPTPVPVEDELYKSIKAAYLVSPDSDAKARLLKVYEVFLEDIKANKFASFAEAGAVLKAAATNTGLQNVKDKVAEHLLATVGPKGWNKTLLETEMSRVIAILKKIQ